MNMKLLTLMLLLSLFVSAPGYTAQEQGPETIRKRMEANLPKIDKLKKAGVVGETNKGYLEAREPLDKPGKELLKVENADRKSIYELLARRAKTKLEQIERARAELIRKRSATGIWLQDAEGEWYRK